MTQIQANLKLLSNQITDDDLTLLLQKWTHKRTLKRFEYLSLHGQVENMLYFINKGTFRTYILNKGVEEDEEFGMPNSFYCSFVSFLTQQPANNTLQALSQAEVIGINRADFYDIILHNRKLERVWPVSYTHLTLPTILLV